MSKTPSIAVIPSGYKASKLYSVLPTDGTGDFTTTRASVATRVNQNGLIEEVASNVPRLDYTGGGCPSLLLEPQSTNLITYSSDIADTSWTKQVSGVASAPVATANYAISPDGTQNASRVVFDLNGGTTTSDFSQLASAITATVGDDYTSSVYMKSNDGSTHSLTFIAVDGSTSIVSVTPQWQRFDVSATLSVASIRIRTRGSEGSSDVTDISIWGAQLEKQSYATSYIKTVGTTQTRVADTASGSGNSTVINSTEGVLYAEISALANDGVNRVISLSNGVLSDNRIELYLDSTPNRIRVRTEVNNGTSIDIISTITDATAINKCGVRWDSTSISLFINGALIETKTSTQFNANILSELKFSNHGGAFPFYGKTKDLRVYTTALSDAELTTLTTI